MMANSELALDWWQVARRRARARARGGDGGMEYLFARVRRELAERLAGVEGLDAGGGRWLLLDLVSNRAGGEGVGACDGLPREFLEVSGLQGGGREVEVEVVCGSCLDWLGEVDSGGGAGAAADLATAANPALGDGGDFSVVVLGLQAAWLPVEVLVAGARRALRAGGVLVFASLGPDTLVEVREAWARVDGGGHVHGFLDMHLVGDALLRGGFEKPIVDVERVRVEYARAEVLVADLRAEGFTNVLRGRRRGLTGKGLGRGFLEALGGVGEPVGVGFELVFGVGRVGDGGVRVAAPE